METAANLSSKLAQNLLSRKNPQAYMTAQGPIVKSKSVQGATAMGAVSMQQKLQGAKIGQVDHGNNNGRARLPPQDLKRLSLNKRTSANQRASAYGSNRQSVVNIATSRSERGNFFGKPGSANQLTQGSIQEARGGTLTQNQIYNRMQQAKLLGNHSNKFPTQMPLVRQRNTTLSNLLRYSSPRGPQHRSNAVTDTRQSFHSNPDGSQTEHLQAAMQNELVFVQGRGGVVYDGSDQLVQVRLDRSTQIFKDPLRAAVSPILSEGSQRQDTDGEVLSKQSSRKESGPSQLKATSGAYEVVETAEASAAEKNANILIRDFATRQNGIVQRAVTLPQSHSQKREKPRETAQQREARRLAEVEAAKARKVHGTHENKQNLFFETKQDNDTGKTVITVARANASKFGNGSLKAEQEYRLVKLNEKELTRAMSDSTKDELKQIKKIQREKEQVPAEVYFEDIYTFPIELKCKKERVEKKRRNLDIGKRLQEERKEHLWEKKQALLAAQIGGSKTKKAQEELAPTDGALGGGRFDYMNIDELKQHESGILNLFEGEKNIAKYVSHTQQTAVAKSFAPLGKSKKYVRLSQFEYETIFEKDPSFNEKRAFVDVFRRKWKEDKGYCSLFDKRAKYRQAKSATIANRLQREQATQALKDKQQRQMLRNYREKIARQEEDQLAKDAEAEHDKQVARERDARSATRLFRKAMRRTRTKSPIRKVQTDLQLGHLRMLKEAEKLDNSQLFRLKKNESLEDMMHQMSSNQYLKQFGSISQANGLAFKTSPRARSAHIARNRPVTGGAQRFQPPRIESSQAPQPRETSNDPPASKAGETSDAITLQGKQARIHQPLQNHDNEYLSNFITQMYQTTSMAYQPKHTVIAQEASSSGKDGFGIQSSAGFQVTGGRDTVDDGQDFQGGTLDSLPRGSQNPAEPFDSKPQTVKFDVLAFNKSAENSGRLTGSVRYDESGKKDTMGGVPASSAIRMNDNDIKIVALAPKDPLPTNHRDLLKIQSQLDKNMLTLKVTRDPKSAKTLPLRAPLMLYQDGSPQMAAESHQYEKKVFSHRENASGAVSPISLKRDQREQLSAHSEKKRQKYIKNPSTSVHLVLKNRGVKIDSKEIQLVKSYGSRSPPRNETHMLNSQDEIGAQRVVQEVSGPLRSSVTGFAHGMNAKVLLNSDQSALLAARQSQQLTDSKDSKLSDEQELNSFMQPKNQRDSIEEQIQINNNQQPLSLPKVSKRDPQQTRDKSNRDGGVAYRANPGIRKAIQRQRSVESSNRAHTAGVSQNSRQVVGTKGDTSQYTEVVSIHSVGPRDEHGNVSRQQRVTVNSSYKSKKTGGQEVNVNRQTKPGGDIPLLNTLGASGPTTNDQRQTQSPISTVAGTLSKSHALAGTQRMVAGVVELQGDPAVHSDQQDAQIKGDLMGSTLEKVTNVAQGNLAASNDVLSGSVNENPFDEWGKPVGGQSKSQLEMYLNQVARPSVYDLPHNPMNHRSYQCNYIKARVETTRMDFIQQQNQTFQFKIEGKASHQGTQAALESTRMHSFNANQDLTLNQSVFMEEARGAQQENSRRANIRAMSANRASASNAYLRNQKQVQRRKKEQQFYYYMQQHRQNKQLLESLEKQAITQPQTVKHMLQASSYGDLAINPQSTSNSAIVPNLKPRPQSHAKLAGQAVKNKAQAQKGTLQKRQDARRHIVALDQRLPKQASMVASGMTTILGGYQQQNQN